MKNPIDIKEKNSEIPKAETIRVGASDAFVLETSRISVEEALRNSKSDQVPSAMVAGLLLFR